MRGGTLNERQEKYAQALASGMTQLEAAAAANYSDASQGGHSRLANDPRVMARVKEIQGAAAKRVEIDKAWVLRKLVRNRRRADQKGDFAACNKALELIGKELGMFVERHELDVQIKRRLIIERMTDADAALMTALVRKIEAPDAE